MDIESIKIIHLCNTFLAGSPMHISGIINKYTNHKIKLL
jgi:hypothetical protein